MGLGARKVSQVCVADSGRSDPKLEVNLLDCFEIFRTLSFTRALKTDFPVLQSAAVSLKGQPRTSGRHYCQSYVPSPARVRPRTHRLVIGGPTDIGVSGALVVILDIFLSNGRKTPCPIKPSDYLRRLWTYVSP